MKKGFTLIELLAVIVILAIIAVIATPIVLSIIKNSKVSSSVRSTENYLDAVENAIAKENLKGEFNPLSCTVTSDNGKTLSCKMSDSTTQELNIDVSGKVAEKGTILQFTKGSVTAVANLKVDGKEIPASSLKLAVAEIPPICTLVSDVDNSSSITRGDKYTCEVKAGTSYIFYVLGTDNGKVNLIMDSNINSDGNPVKGAETNLGFVAWYVDEADNSKGPTTALDYLNTTTASWDKLESLNIEYTDEGGKYGTIKFTGKARLPYYSEIGNYDSTTGENEFLYENLDLEAVKYGAPSNVDHMPGVGGYWSASAYANDSYFARLVHCFGNISSNVVIGGNSLGVRPVITVEI